VDCWTGYESLRQLFRQVGYRAMICHFFFFFTKNLHRFYYYRDLVEKWPENERSKIRLILDCASPVPMFEHEASKFVQTMKEKGITLCTSSNAVSCT